MVETKTFLSLLFFSIFILHSLSFSTDTFIYGGCAQQTFTSTSPYEYNLNSLLTSLVNSATYTSYNNFTIVASNPNDVVYGLYQCRGDLSMPDCASCVSRAVSRAGDICSVTRGGVVQLEGCYVKYDNIKFLGVEDKTVVLKKCGSSIGYDPSTRDAVLAGMVGSGGYFRVGGSGQVKGMVQCIGDLSFLECQDCVSEAIQRLRSDCPAADYGDMFLAKCYARYSNGGAGGAHAYSKSHGKSDNDSEKTFAIIIGLLAAVAILIIFLAFLRRICEGHHGK
ncbi:unnamed protein product [Lathyrus sativus]|nr:unnamed protein product [Lathyrus sativus]